MFINHGSKLTSTGFPNCSYLGQVRSHTDIYRSKTSVHYFTLPCLLYSGQAEGIYTYTINLQQDTYTSVDLKEPLFEITVHSTSNYTGIHLLHSNAY